MIHPQIQVFLPTMQQLMAKHRIVRGYLFGSAVTERFNETSDLDILVDIDAAIDPVEMGGHLWDLQFDLEKILSRKVDLLTSRALRNKYFISAVEETKELVYG